ncbi:MAG: ribosomal protein S18-alanine N-acetyltransferase [Methanomicrobiales archaeon]|nr:ribosomal protein S18-alanine N-acetyltransferase [Methanomicrobiales archaeon]MDI6875561.1 ribosomal protein S18-alanine N-acetyltransferase [Methanomicrobiales archaeon]
MSSNSVPSSNSVNIRRARPSDIPVICEIENASFIEPWDPETFILTMEWNRSSFFVAESNGHIVGFLAGAMEDMGDGIYGHICNLAVRAECRNRGIGTKLVRRAEHQFAVAGVSGVILEVRASNTAAQRFYRHLGYNPVYRVPAYYSDGEDAILMMREFYY